MGYGGVIVGVVGVLQFDVLKYRLENEYNVEIRMTTFPYEHIRWIENEDINMDKIVGTSDMKKIPDLKGRPLLLFVNSWSVGMVLDRNEGLVLSGVRTRINSLLSDSYETLQSSLNCSKLTKTFKTRSRYVSLAVA